MVVNKKFVVSDSWLVTSEKKRGEGVNEQAQSKKLKRLRGEEA